MKKYPRPQRVKVSNINWQKLHDILCQLLTNIGYIGILWPQQILIYVPKYLYHITLNASRYLFMQDV